MDEANENELIRILKKGTGMNGKNTRLTEPFRPRLSKALSGKAIKQHPTKTYLSTIKSIFIVERLNDVFGVCGWDFEHEVVEKTTNGDKPYIVVKGRIYIREFDLYTPFQYGGHDLGGKGTEPADGYKSAVTDAMSKCASLLEIGIQVFKGEPSSQESNKSKRLDNVQETKPLEKPTYEPITQEAEPDKEDMDAVEKEEVSDEMKELIERHTELFGKPPSKQAKAETIRKKIAKIEGETLPPPSPEPIDEDVEEEIIVEENEEEEDVFAFEEGDTEENVDSEKAEDIMEKHRDEVNSYLDGDELKENAGAIVFDAQMDGATEEQLKELKIMINERYKALKDA